VLCFVVSSASLYCGCHSLLCCLFFFIQFPLTHSFFLVPSISSWLLVVMSLHCVGSSLALVLRMKGFPFLELGAPHETSYGSFLGAPVPWCSCSLVPASEPLSCWLLLVASLYALCRGFLLGLGSPHKTFSIPQPWCSAQNFLGALHKTSFAPSSVLMFLSPCLRDLFLLVVGCCFPPFLWWFLLGDSVPPW
jgi:hypothetical protein